jgi:hypothetical protein
VLSPHRQGVSIHFLRPSSLSLIKMPVWPLILSLYNVFPILSSSLILVEKIGVLSVDVR